LLWVFVLFPIVLCTVHYRDEEIVLSKEKLRMIMRIKKGQFPHVQVKGGGEVLDAGTEGMLRGTAGVPPECPRCLCLLLCEWLRQVNPYRPRLSPVFNH
jgi:hypothetical protein